MAFVDIEFTSGGSVQRAEYDSETQTLRVTYANGSVYHANGISEDKARDFSQAPSAGSFWHANIKNEHVVSRIS